MEIEKQLEEARQRDKERARALIERVAVIEEKKGAQIDGQTIFILHRAELCSEIKGLIQELGWNETLAAPLKWLCDNISFSRTSEQLSRFEESFRRLTLPKVKLRLQEKKKTAGKVKSEKEVAKWIADFKKETERKAALEKKEQVQKESKRRREEILNLKESLKSINYYLGRKELREGEDPVFTLQQLKIVQPVESSTYPRVSEKLVKGFWLWNRWSGKSSYMPPMHDFRDYGATIQRWPREIINGKLYKWSKEVKSWTSWVSVWPLLQAKKAQILGKMAAVSGSGKS